MPRTACCNPFGIHRALCKKNLRQVNDATASVSSLVNKGDYVCDFCRKKLTVRPKAVPSTPESLALDPGPPNPGPPNPGPPYSEPPIPDPPIPDPSMLQGTSAAIPINGNPLPSTSGTQNGVETLEFSTDESFIGDSADESAEESTADEYSTEVDEEIAQPILNEFLPTLGQSPVKRSKGTSRMKHEDSRSFFWFNFIFKFFSLQRGSRNGKKVSKSERKQKLSKKAWRGRTVYRPLHLPPGEP